MNANDSNRAQSASTRVIIERDLSHAIIGCFFDVYNELGYGFMELLYARALRLHWNSEGCEWIGNILSPSASAANRLASTASTC